MKATELRIGNWVKDSKGNPRRIVGFTGFKDDKSIFSVWFEIGAEPKYYSFLQDIKPIPLTPEILEKAGFEKVEQYETAWKHPRFTAYFYLKCAPDYREGFGAKLVFCDSPESGVSYTPTMNAPMYYLHQLQNLYHSLCGEELNIEL